VPPGAPAALFETGADGADEAVADGAEEEENEEHPDSAGKMPIEMTMRSVCPPLPRPALWTFGRMGPLIPTIPL
jgi:hypothetical protein